MEVSIKGSCALTQELAQSLKRLACEFCLAFAFVVGRVQVSAFFGLTTEVDECQGGCGSMRQG